MRNFVKLSATFPGTERNPTVRTIFKLLTSGNANQSAMLLTANSRGGKELGTGRWLARRVTKIDSLLAEWESRVSWENPCGAIPGRKDLPESDSGLASRVVTELEQIKTERDAALHVLDGLRNAPRTKRSLKRHLEVLEKQIEFLEGGSKNISPLISLARETPSFKEQILDTQIKES